VLARTFFPRLRTAWCSVQRPPGAMAAPRPCRARPGDARYALDASDSLDAVCFPRPRADNVLTAAATSVTGRQP
jgi:hypothetical protein